MEYSKKTSIHGVRYLSEVHRPFYEKSLWIVLLSVALYFAIYLSRDNFLKWQNSPVILGFDETLVPVHEIPFPTITICPEIKMESRSLNFTKVSQQMRQEIEEYGAFKNHMNFTQEQISKFAATLHICEADVIELFANFIPKGVESDVAETLAKLAVSKNITVPFCKWNGRLYFCETIFNLIATDEGICYQFNGLGSEVIYRDERYISYYDKDKIDFNDFVDDAPSLNNITGCWSLDDGFIDQGSNSYPQRTVFASARNGLFVTLEGFRHDFEYECRRFKEGYRVFFNSPESVPVTTGSYILVPHGHEILVTVLPEYVISSKGLRRYSPRKRQCYFDNERHLRFFRFYSQSNCQIECLTNFTITKCGCAKFWMPKPVDVPACQLSDVKCCTEAQDELSLLLRNQSMQHLGDSSEEIMCDCMLACTSLEYNFEISSADFDLARTLKALRMPNKHPDFLASRLTVYFKDRQFTAIKRSVHFSTTTLIANYGGIFSLFMGMSIVSVIEFIYFFSMRLRRNLKSRRVAKNTLKHQVMKE